MMRRYLIIGGVLLALSGIAFLVWPGEQSLAQGSGRWNLSAVSLWNQLKGVLSLGKSALTIVEQTEITAAQRAIIESNGHDYSSLYRILESASRDFKKIEAICANFNPVFCLRKAAEQNPLLRREICRLLGSEIWRQYQGRVNVSEHQRECLLGIPQYAY